MFCGLCPSLVDDRDSCEYEAKIVLSHLLDIVTGTNVHDDVFQIAKFPGNIQRVREGHQDGGI
jgi:hypothetical protein